MKQLFFVLALSLATGLLISQNAQQKEKTAAATLTESEWSWVITQIEDSPTPGSERRLVGNKIREQIIPQLYPSIKKDSTATIPPQKKKQ